MNTSERNKLIAGAGIVAGVLLLYKLKRSYSRPGRSYYRPGEHVKTTAGAQFVLRLPRGRYDMLGDDVGQDPGVTLIAINEMGNASDAILAANDTAIPVDATVRFVNLDRPELTYLVHVHIQPMPEE